MPFSIRPLRCLPVSSPVSYHAGLFEGRGTVWNLSLKGWRLSGDLPLRVGETYCFTIHLPHQQSITSRLPLCGGYETKSMESNRCSWGSTRTIYFGTM
jgi:hypothetical protein